MDLSQLAKLKDLKKYMDRLRANHPKFPRFCQAVYQRALEEGSLVEIRVTTPDGTTWETNLKLKADDIESIRALEEMKNEFKF